MTLNSLQCVVGEISVKVVEILENESLNFDEIVRRLRLDPSKTGSTLSVMEIKGILKNSGGSYSLSN